ncbi:hypothetical protein GCM10007116_12180 [Sulfodiicoccus acidiphilus]|nr:MarR family transcriptional regulator [Sulfodiicoccus acidiphilus]GGT96210.1 hypothetical protein GCM10007116_12180 [Sulfodiicoccus acidiphilus]
MEGLDALKIWDDLFRSFKRVLREAEKKISAVGLTWTEFRILSLICGEPKSMATLANETMLSPAAITSLIDKLESQGYAKRIRCATDRRLVKVELTEEGLALLSKAREIQRAYIESILPSLAQELQDVLMEINEWERKRPAQQLQEKGLKLSE